MAWRSEEVPPTDSLPGCSTAWSERKSFCELPSDPLTENEALDLLRGRSTLEPERERQILTRAQGNPLFLVAYQDALGSENENLPADLDRLLSHRFDRMSDAATQVLRRRRCSVRAQSCRLSVK